MKNISLGLCLLVGLLLHSGIYAQNYFEERYQPDDNIYGTWTAQMPESFTSTKKLPTITATFVKSDQSFSFIDSLEASDALAPDFKLHFSVDSISMFEILSAGRLMVEMDDCKRDRTTAFSGDFMLIKIRNQVRLFHTIENAELVKDFAPMSFSFMRTKATELATDELIFDSFLFYVGTIIFRKKGPQTSVTTPTRLTNLPNTNWSNLGLYGAVKTMNEKRFIHGSSRDEGTFAIMLSSLIRYSFSSEGLTTQQQHFSFQDKSWFHYDFQGTYQRQVLLKRSGPDSVYIGPRHYVNSDSVVFIRTDSLERMERYYQNELHSIYEHQLMYNRAVRRTIVKSALEGIAGAKEQYMDFHYSGDYLQERTKLWTQEGEPLTTFEYFVYEEFDDHGNWTKRLLYDKECSDRIAFVETREFEYWED